MAGSARRSCPSTRTYSSTTSRAALSALFQYNSSNSTLSSNVRFRWEYRPGSDFFIVYSEGRDTSLPHEAPRLANHSVAVKFTKLFRF